MNRFLKLSLLAGACALGAAVPAGAQNSSPPTGAGASASGGAAVSSAANRLAPRVSLGGQTLLLNGKGTRYRAFIRVYEIGIYATTKVNSLEQFLAAPGAKQMQLITLRELSGDSLGVAMVQGMQDNAQRDERVKLLAHMNLLAKVFGEERNVPAGSVLTIDHVPGKGSMLTLNGVQKGLITDPIFFPAAARIWLGDKPVDLRLKDALLGTPTYKSEAG